MSGWILNGSSIWQLMHLIRNCIMLLIAQSTASTRLNDERTPEADNCDPIIRMHAHIIRPVFVVYCGSKTK